MINLLMLHWMLVYATSLIMPYSKLQPKLEVQLHQLNILTLHIFPHLDSTILLHIELNGTFPTDTFQPGIRTLYHSPSIDTKHSYINLLTAIFRVAHPYYPALHDTEPTTYEHTSRCTTRHTGMLRLCAQGGVGR